MAEVQTERFYGDLPDDDAALAALAQKGSADARDRLIRKYIPLVRSRAGAYFIAGAESEDIIQEGMIGLFKAVMDFDSGRDASFFTFAKLCVTRQILTAVKAATRQKHIPLNNYISLNKPSDEDQGGVGSAGRGLDSDPETLYIGKEAHRSIENFIEARLSCFEQSVLYLYLSGESYHDISDRLGKSVKSVDNALQRIKRKLSTSLLERDQDT